VIRPAFRPKYCVEAIPGEGFLLASESDSHVIEGAVFAHLVPLIDGRRTTAELVELLRPVQEERATLDALSFLAAHGHIAEADGLPPQYGAFWNEVGADTRKLPGLFANCPVTVLDLAELPHPQLLSTLASFGVRTTPTPAPLGVVVVDNYLDPRLDALNRQALQSRTPWLLAKPDGLKIWLGPMFVPGRGPCWECLAQRLRANREVEGYLRRRSGRSEPLATTRARLWPTRQQAYSMVATQLVRWMVHGQHPALENSLTIVDTVAFDFGRHPVLRRPQCPVCGDVRLAQAPPERAELRSDSEQKTSLVDGGERHESPEITFERFRHLVSPVTGIVKAVDPSPWHVNSPLRTYVAGHNFALTHDSLHFVKDSLRTMSSGKGRTDAQARTSALCEALERYSGRFQGDEPRRSASLRQLGSAALEPNRCMLFSETQYRERDGWLARGARFQVVPRPFDDAAVIEWSPVWSLTEKTVKYLPTSYLYYGYPYRDDQFFCWSDSNGNAAGRSFDDACLQGLYELVERDAVALWWYSRARRPGVDLDSLADPYIDELRAFYGRHRREFWVLDLSNDTGIPAFAAITRRIDGGPTEDIVLGFGAHADARIAISRALTEMNQFIPAVLDVHEDGRTAYAIHDGESLRWWQTATLAGEPYLEPTRLRPIGDYETPPRASIRERRIAAVRQIEALGHEVLVLDQTRPDVGLAVVKVLAPGLRHFWARFAPGRLYDVPAKLGWVEAPLAESALNPIPMFL
jgi:ribosomal protein S12 methylthiotransferase accessory factor